jgi:hypothetical protein
VLLSTLMIGLTILAIQTAGTDASLTSAGSTPADSRRSQGETRDVAIKSTRSGHAPIEITRGRLQRLGSVALGIAIFSLLPSRKVPTAVDTLTPQLVAQKTGRPVLGNLFQAGPPAPRTSGFFGRLIRGVVEVSEMLLCAGVTLALASCILKPDLIWLFGENPLVGYVEAIRHLAITIQAWIPLQSART